MPKPPPDYNREKQKRWRENADKVQSLANSRDEDLMKKIDTHSWRFGHSSEAILKKILADPMFADIFAVNPVGQTFHERLAADWIEQLALVKEFKSLPGSGKNALFIDSKGKIVQGRPASANYKSLDFKWITNNFHCYATHKCTEGQGGSQGSSGIEVRATLERFQKGGALKNTALFAIVDGSFYTKDWIKEARKMVRIKPPYSFVIPISELPKKLTLLVEKSKPK